MLQLTIIVMISDCFVWLTVQSPKIFYFIIIEDKENWTSEKLEPLFLCYFPHFFIPNQ